MSNPAKSIYSELVKSSIEAISEEIYSSAEQRAWLNNTTSINWEERLQSQKIFERWEENQLIAFATLNNEIIDFLFVLPTHWKQGIAAQLLNEIEEFAEKNGLDKLQIFASKMAFPTCLKAGFAVLQSEHIEIENQVLQRFYMQKPLNNGRRNSRILYKTARLYLREMLPIDAENFYELNNDWEVMKYTGDIPFDSIEASRLFLENYDPYSKTGFGRWTLIRKMDGKTIGWCGIKQQADGSIDLGYRLFEKYWNQGFATEASLKSMEIAKNDFGIKKLVLEANEQNGASRAVAIKLGFEFVGFVEVDDYRDALYQKNL